jgi:hypothetical protein
MMHGDALSFSPVKRINKNLIVATSNSASQENLLCDYFHCGNNNFYDSLLS